MARPSQRSSRRPAVRTAVAAVVLAPLLAGGAAAAPRAVTVLPPLGAGTMPSPTATAAVVGAGAAARPLGGGLAGEVVDAQTGTVLWQRAPSAPLLVASTQKLLVAAAALSVLGPAAAPLTTVETAGTTRGHVLAGDLYLRGGGDVLLQPSAAGGWPATASLDQLAAALRATGVTAVTGRLVADGTAFTGPTTAPGWRPTYVSEGSVAPVSALEVDHGRQPGTNQRAADPAYAAGSAFRAALARHGVTVAGATVDGATPAGTHRLAVVAGPTVDAEVGEMLADSDNDLAESLGRRLAIAQHLPPTFAGAAAAVTATLGRLGLPTAGLRLDDASGLSRRDAVPPALLAAVLRQAATTRPAWRPVLAGLPVAAFSGTLRGRDVNPGPAAGVVRAKTGNLAGVTAEAGTVVTAHGRQLAFAFVTDSAVGLVASEVALDDLAAALVGL